MVEQIHPKCTAKPGTQLELCLDNLGNPTILSPKVIDATGGKSFVDKKRYFQASHNMLNCQVGA